MGHTISETGVTPYNLTEAINNKNPSANTKTMKYFIGALQSFAKIILNVYEKTDKMRQRSKKITKWELTEQRNSDFNNGKKTQPKIL